MPMPVTISELEIPGVLLVETGRVSDHRGCFSEVYSETVWKGAGFSERFVQDNISLSKRGTLRGMHYQIEPFGIGKLVRAVTGAIFDVGVDLRRGSPAFGRWVGRTLSAENGHALYFPPGFAHGFVALEDDTIVYYKCTQMHVPEAERALHFADPQVGIEWPMEPLLIAKKDAEAPLLERAEYNFEF